MIDMVGAESGGGLRPDVGGAPGGVDWTVSEWAGLGRGWGWSLIGVGSCGCFLVWGEQWREKE